MLVLISSLSLFRLPRFLSPFFSRAFFLPLFLVALYLRSSSYLGRWIAPDPFPSPTASRPCSPLSRTILVTTLLTPTTPTAVMADYNYGGSEEENAELKKLETELV